MLVQERVSDLLQLRGAHEAVVAACADVCMFGSYPAVRLAADQAIQAALGLCAVVSKMLR